MSINDYCYTLNDMVNATKKSYQSIHALYKRNKDELSQYSHLYGRTVKFNEDGLNWFLTYYNINPLDDKISSEKAPILPETKTGGTELPQKESTAETASKAEIEALLNQLASEKEKTALLQAKVEALTASVAEKAATITKLEAKNDEVQKQLGLTLLLVQQEQQTNLRLLPTPKKPLTERIKDMFQKKPKLK